jgi:hypothetical protein
LFVELCLNAPARALPSAAPFALAVAAQLALAPPGADAWARAELGGVRGITIGPIENGYHPGVGYGSLAYDRTLAEARAMGATWVAVTPFGRVADLHGAGVDLTFEQPFADNRRDVARAIAMAHARGLRVLLVPHMWVESGEWRALVNPGTDEGWARWAESYGRFVHAWAEVAEEERADMLSVGVELRSWATTPRAPSLEKIIDDVRRTYGGVLTYSANWDDVDDTVILGKVDVVGVNAFYPLADQSGASDAQLAEGGAACARRSTRSPSAGRSPSSSPRSGTRRVPIPRSSRGSGPTRWLTSPSTRPRRPPPTVGSWARCSTSPTSPASSCGASTRTPTTSRRRPRGASRRAASRRSS